MIEESFTKVFEILESEPEPKDADELSMKFKWRKQLISWLIPSSDDIGSEQCLKNESKSESESMPPKICPVCNTDAGFWGRACARLCKKNREQKVENARLNAELAKMNSWYCDQREEIQKLQADLKAKDEEIARLKLDIKEISECNIHCKNCNARIEQALKEKD